MTPDDKRADAFELFDAGFDCDDVAERLNAPYADVERWAQEWDEIPDAAEADGFREPEEPEGDEGFADYGYSDDSAFRVNPRETF